MTGKGKGLIIAGTDTGVGKTVVCGALCATLRGMGVDVGVMKPVESGCRLDGGERVPEDAIFLRRMAASKDELRLVNPYALEAAIAPALAARIEGIDVRLDVVKKAFFRLALRHEVVLVEGAGGLLSPLAEKWSLPDLAREVGAPIVIVGRNTLGTINHCLLTLSCARSEGIRVLGVVLNQAGDVTDMTAELNPEAIREWGGVPVLGVMPYLLRKTEPALTRAMKANIDLQPVIGWLGR